MATQILPTGIKNTSSSDDNITLATDGGIDVNNGQLVVDDASSTVAVANALTVGGDITASGSVNIAAGLTVLASSNLGSVSASSGDFTGNVDIDGNLAVDTDTLFVDSANNRVGIGTTSGVAKLTVEDTNPNEVAVHVNNTGGVNSIVASTGSSYSFSGVGTNTTWLTTNGTRLAVGPYQTGSSLQFINSGEQARIDSSGRLLIGVTDTQGPYLGIQPKVQIEGSTYDETTFSLYRNTNGIAAESPVLVLGRSRGTAPGDVDALNVNDRIGTIGFAGADGTNRGTGAASIEGFVDKTASDGNLPGRLIFLTSDTGDLIPVERMRIDSNGCTIVGGTQPSNDNSIIDAFAMGGENSPWRRYFHFNSGGAPRTLTFDNGAVQYFARVRVVGWGNYSPNISEVQFIAAGRGSNLGHSHQVTQIGAATNTSIAVATSDAGNVRTYTLTIDHTDGLNKSFMVEIEMFNAFNFSIV